MRTPDEAIVADMVRMRAEARPDLDVLTFEHLSLDGEATPDEVRTYADLATNANRLAAALIGRGLERGDRFGLMMRNHPEFVEAMVAASISGTVFVPVDPRTRGEKLSFYLRRAGCRGLVVADYCLGAFDAARHDVPGLEWVLGLETGETDDASPLDAVAGVDSLRAVLAAESPTVDVRAESPADPFQIMFTSGTTGDPKGTVGANQRFGGVLGVLFGYQPDERPYTGLSLTHTNAQAVTLGPALRMGLRAVFSRRFTKSRLWDVCRRHGCTQISLVGGMATAIYSEPPRPDDADNPVRLVVSGGMPPAIWEAFEARFGVRILEFYGANDGGGMAFNPVGVGPVGSVGKPMPGLEMKVLDDDGRECPPGVVGEICCRPAGGSAAVEYFGDPEASAAKCHDGWNHSGDMGHTDEDGWLFFDHRRGGGIRHNGDFVEPGYVEKVLAEHPDVVDVFVYGIPAASGAPGEKDVVAAVVLREGVETDAASLFATCRAGLEPNFVPTFLQVVPEIPKTASEKPQERFLRELGGFLVGQP
ncbi:MAG: AMP-binding protein [Acidimicrobiia bacterium]|nr:AMP-binding protein [Acidimicrobiia bacterium]